MTGRMRGLTAIIGIVALSFLAAAPAGAAGDGGLQVIQAIAGGGTDPVRPVDYLLDGDPATAWGFVPGATEGWAELTLAKPSLIHGLRLAGALGRGADLRVEYEREGRWIPFAAAVFRTLPADGLLDLSLDRAVTAKLRLGLEGNGVPAAELAELAVLGRAADAVLHRIEPRSVLASANTSPVHLAAYLADGNTRTRWATRAASCRGEVLFVLDGAYTLRNINIFLTPSAAGEIRLEIPDGQGWRALGAISSAIKGWRRLDLEGENARTDRVRLIVEGRGEPGGIGEVEIWGYGAYAGGRWTPVGIQRPRTIAEPLNLAFEAITRPGANDALVYGSLQVLYRCTSSSPRSSSIQHAIRIVNTGASVIDLAEVKARYWFTDEPQKPQTIDLYWATAGKENVTAAISPCQGLPGAGRCLEIGFTPAAGKLIPGACTEVQLGIHTKDWAVYLQTDDYSFDGSSADFGANPRYAAYLAGSLAWGAEPPPGGSAGGGAVYGNPFRTGPGTPAGGLRVLYRCVNAAAAANNIQHDLRIVNTGGQTIDLKNVKARYWYTKEPLMNQRVNVYWASVGANKVKAKLMQLPAALPGADHCLELSFTGGSLAPGEYAEIELGFNAADWADYYQPNDYSFDGEAAGFRENPRYTAYQAGLLAWGQEPAAAEPEPREAIDHELILVFAGETAEPVSLEINGESLAARAALLLRGHTVHRLAVPARLLNPGANYLRIPPAAVPRVLVNAFVAAATRDGRQTPPAPGGLGDGLLLTAAATASGVVEYSEMIVLEEAIVHTLHPSPVRLAAEVDGVWIDLHPTGIHDDRIVFRAPVTASRFRLEGHGGGNVAELEVLGGSITDRAPIVRIDWPADGEEIDLEGWGARELAGFVDDPEARVLVNGAAADQDGHRFTIKLNRTGLRPWETTTIAAMARDGQGREGAHEITVSLGRLQECSIDQPDELVRTREAVFRISGTAAKDYLVRVDGRDVPVSGSRFAVDVPLQAGYNRIEIEFTDPRKNISRTHYRRVVRTTGEVFLTVDSPRPGAYLNAETAIVAGAVEAAGDVAVTVNGVPAPVAGGAYQSPPIALAEGENRILVQAADGAGGTARAEVTVYCDRTAPELTEVLPAEDATVNVSSVTVSGKATDVSPVTVLINGRAAAVEEGRFSMSVHLAEGVQTMRVLARDAAGNETAVWRRIVSDTVPPEPFAVAVTPAGRYTEWINENRPVFTFTATDETSGVVRYDIRIDGGEWIEAATSPYQFADPIADGEHTVEVKAVDGAGWERIAAAVVKIDTAAPEAPAIVRVIPGNGQIRVAWKLITEPRTAEGELPEDPPMAKYLIERDPVFADGQAIMAGDVKEYLDAGLDNGAVYAYRLAAVDLAGNEGAWSTWHSATVGVAVAAIQPESETIIEYENVVLSIPKEVLPAEIDEVRISEVDSEHLQEQTIYPMVGPVYEFMAYASGEEHPLENVAMEQGYLARIHYDQSQVPAGFPEHNLDVYYYDPMFDRWFMIPSAGVDIENNDIYFFTNHFSSFSIQATIVQDLSPQEYKDAGFSPLKSYSIHGGIAVSPQGGTASTQVTELVLPGKNGFDLVLSRRYDTATARSDALALEINGRLGINLVSPGGGLLEKPAIIKAAEDIRSTADKVDEAIKKIIEEYLFNQGDYAYSMGQGWRLNIPYVKASNGCMVLVTPNGGIHAINEMSMVGLPVSLPHFRAMTFEQHEGDDFTLQVAQVKDEFVSVLLNREEIFKSRWYSLWYKLIMKDGTVYEMDPLGRTTKIIDPSGLHEINLVYDGLFLDYIEDTMGRKVRFSYDLTLLWPRISGIWVEGDPYQRAIEYEVGLDSLLHSAKDAGGRTSTYEYDFRLLLGGEAGCTINILTMVLKAIGGPFAGLAGTIFGANDIDLHAGLQAQMVFPMKEMTAPGQGTVRIQYDQPSIIYGTSHVNRFWFIPVSVTFSLHLEQRLLANKVSVYLDPDGAPVRTTSYIYDIGYHSNGQAFIDWTEENDGKKKTIYHYTAVEKPRYRWEDKYTKYQENGDPAKFALWFPMTFWTVHILPINTTTEFYEANGNLLEWVETSYNTDTMRPLETTTRRGETHYKRVKYQYDKWGNPTYVENRSVANGRTNQLKTWMYYLQTGTGPSPDVTWLESPFTQPASARERRDLLVGQVTANHTPMPGGGEEMVIYQHAYFRYNELGQQTGIAKWNGTDWDITEMTYHPTLGSIATRVDPEGLVTVYDYDSFGFPTSIVWGAVKDADGNAADIETRTGYDPMTGWKKWEKDGRGYVTEYECDALGRVTKITLPDDDDDVEWDPNKGPSPARANNPAQSISFDDVELITTVTDPLGNRVVYDYDSLGRLHEIVKNTKTEDRYSVTQLNYDAYGNIIEIIDPNGTAPGVADAYKYTTRYEYDALGNLERIIYPDETPAWSDNPCKRFDRDLAAMLTTITDEEGKVTEQYTDMEGRVVREVKRSPAGDIETSIFYDGAGNKVQVIEARGHVTRMYYNVLNQLVRVELPQDTFWENGVQIAIKPVVTYAYDSAGNRIAETRELGGGATNTVSTEYDGLKRPIKTTTTFTDRDGTVKTAVAKTYYDANGNKVRVVDANNTPKTVGDQKHFSYVYSARNWLLAETDPEGHTVSYTYDAAGNRTSLTDQRGNATTTVNDYTIWYEYDDLYRLVRGILPDSTPPADPFANPGDNPVVRFTYDRRGTNLTRHVKPNEATDGQLTTYEYHPRYWLKTETTSGDGSSLTTAYTYDKIGNVRTVTDPRGQVTTYSYDDFHRRTGVLYPEGNTESYEYDRAGNMTRLTDGRGKHTTYTYNTQNKPTSVTDAKGAITSYAYDRWSNQTRMRRPEGQVTTYAYDELNRLVKVVDPLSFETVYGYDLVGNRSYARDPNGNESFYTYDADNLLKRILVLNGLDGKCVDYEYDPAHQQILAVQYLARLAQAGAEPELSEESRLARTYTILGQVETETRQAASQFARTVTYDYDYLGNMSSMLYPTATEPLEYQYNNLGQLTSIPGFIEGLPGNPGIVYDRGLPRTVRYANGVTLNYTYDRNGRLDTRIDTHGGTQLFSLDLNYDPNGNIITRAVDGKTNTYAYDDLNQLEHATVYANLVEQTRTTDYGLGQVHEDYRGEKIVEVQPEDFQVNLDYAATSLSVVFNQVAERIQRLELTPAEAEHRLTDRRYLEIYYVDGTGGHKLDREDWGFSLDGPTGRIAITFPDLLTAYEVKIHCHFDERDGDYQPVKASEFNNLAQAMVKVFRVYVNRYEDYIYDRNGNRTSETITTLYPRTYGYTYYPNSDRLKTREISDGTVKWAFVYDNNGNLVEKGNTYTVSGDTVNFITSGEGVVYRRYQYDVFNRLESVKKNGVTISSYIYDPTGLRIVKQASQVTVYDYDLAGNVIGEKTGSGIKSYVWVSGRHLARVDGLIGDSTATKYFYETDHLGSSMVVTDQSGEVVWRGDFTSFGERISREGQPGEFVDTHGFTGKDWDEDAGLYYFNARWYDPELGRFVTEDAYSGDPNDPKTLNLYTYCQNCPIVKTDRTGYDPEVENNADWALVDYEEEDDGTYVYTYYDDEGDKLVSQVITIGDVTYIVNTYYRSDDSPDHQYAFIIKDGDAQLIQWDDLSNPGPLEIIGDMFEDIGETLADVATCTGQFFADNAGPMLEILAGAGLEVLGFTADLGTIALGAVAIPTAGGSLALAPVTVSASTVAKAAGIGLIGHGLYLMSQNAGNSGTTYRGTSWNQGSFGTPEESLYWHFKKHGAEVGATDFGQYLRKAVEFSRNLRGAKVIKNIEGAVSGVTRYIKNGKFIDLATDGSIISFGRI